MIPLLLVRAGDLGFQIRLGEFYRWPQMAIWNSQHCRVCGEDYVAHDVLDHVLNPIGIRDSLHCDKLAGDIILFWDGKPCWKTEQYGELGEYLESQEELASWGGRFNDGGHFSIMHGGKR